MKWFNVLGLLFQFLSFWLAAPEIPGGTGLKRIQNMITSLVINFAIIIFATLLFVYVLTLNIPGVVNDLKGSEAGINIEELIRFNPVLFVIATVCCILISGVRKVMFRIDNRIPAIRFEKYIQSGRLRRSSFLTIAILFTCGFAFQFICILLQP